MRVARKSAPTGRKSVEAGRITGEPVGRARGAPRAGTTDEGRGAAEKDVGDLAKAIAEEPAGSNRARAGHSQTGASAVSRHHLCPT